MILKNAIQTPDGTILQSYHIHDFKSHIDTVTNHVYSVDGGTQYLRRGGPPGYKELFVHDDGNHETRRNNLHWGKNYDKNNNRLPETEWVLIKDLDTDHIKAILELYAERESIFMDIMRDELNYRKNK
jgi:hypothetical protein